MILKQQEVDILRQLLAEQRDYQEKRRVVDRQIEDLMKDAMRDRQFILNRMHVQTPVVIMGVASVFPEIQLSAAPYRKDGTISNRWFKVKLDELKLLKHEDLPNNGGTSAPHEQA